MTICYIEPIVRIFRKFKVFLFYIIENVKIMLILFKYVL